MKIKLPLFLGTLACVSAQASLFYFNDFSVPVGPEWSDSSRETTPVGARQFLGRFASDTVSLSLTGLPAHTQVSVSFDLFIINSWDGSDLTYGPDRFRSSIGDGIFQKQVLDTTFSNVNGPPPVNILPQSYPDSYSSGITHPARTGAAEVDSLGYDIFGDTVYHITISANHSAGVLSVTYKGLGLGSLSDESWGIDNVQVDVSTAVPEPSTYAAAVGLALLAFAVGRHIRKA